MWIVEVRNVLTPKLVAGYNYIGEVLPSWPTGWYESVSRMQCNYSLYGNALRESTPGQNNEFLLAV
jgi:hypothetical protein